MNNLEYYGELISEDSIIRLIDGREMKGKLEITKGILDCCEQYHKDRTNRTRMTNAKYGLIAVGLGIITNIGIQKIIQIKKDKQFKQK